MWSSLEILPHILTLPAGGLTATALLICVLSVIPGIFIVIVFHTCVYVCITPGMCVVETRIQSVYIYTGLVRMHPLGDVCTRCMR